MHERVVDKVLEKVDKPKKREPRELKIAPKDIKE
jgi:hypothetical protein